MKVRPACPADAPAIASVHVDAWRETYTGLMPDELLAGLSYERRQQMWERVLSQPDHTGVFVAEAEHGEVVAFASCGPERAKDPEYKGELYAIYALKKSQGRGAGRALFEAAVGWLVGCGCESMLLWVLDTNPTRGFYERMGGTACREKVENLGEFRLREVGYGWKEIGELLHRNTPKQG